MKRVNWALLLFDVWVLAAVDFSAAGAALVAGGLAAALWLAKIPGGVLLPFRAEPPVRGAAVAHQITTSKPERKQVTFQIDDDEFTFACPKLAAAMRPLLEPNGDGDGASNLSMTQAAWKWLRSGLPEDQYEHLMGRLEDEDDGLDIPDVAEVVRYLMGEATGRPTGSRSG